MAILLNWGRGEQAARAFPPPMFPFTQFHFVCYGSIGCFEGVQLVRIHVCFVAVKPTSLVFFNVLYYLYVVKFVCILFQVFAKKN